MPSAKSSVPEHAPTRPLSPYGSSKLMAERIPISAADTAETIHDRLAELGARLIVSTLDGLVMATRSGSIDPGALKRNRHFLHRLRRLEFAGRDVA